MTTDKKLQKSMIDWDKDVRFQKGGDPIGTVRPWADGVNHKKVAEGKWEKVKNRSKPSKKEETKKETKPSFDKFHIRFTEKTMINDYNKNKDWAYNPSSDYKKDSTLWDGKKLTEKGEKTLIKEIHSDDEAGFESAMDELASKAKQAYKKYFDNQNKSESKDSKKPTKQEIEWYVTSVVDAFEDQIGDDIGNIIFDEENENLSVSRLAKDYVESIEDQIYEYVGNNWDNGDLGNNPTIQDKVLTQAVKAITQSVKEEIKAYRESADEMGD